MTAHSFKRNEVALNLIAKNPPEEKERLETFWKKTSIALKMSGARSVM